MARHKRGGYIFQTWVGDHPPRHVHVYQDGKMVLKFDLKNGLVMSGKVSKRLIRYIQELSDEGVL